MNIMNIYLWETLEVDVSLDSGTLSSLYSRKWLVIVLKMIDE